MNTSLFLKNENIGKTVIKISTNWLTRKFKCSYAYILNCCKGYCCEGSDKIMISLLPEEEEWHRKAGYKVGDGFLLADPYTRKCPHKLSTGLCKVHGTKLKPFGCILSPFTINKNNTLIIRYRYSRLKCFGDGDYAYNVFSPGLELLFGDETEKLIELLKSKDKIFLPVDNKILEKVKYLDNLKKYYAQKLD